MHSCTTFSAEVERGFISRVSEADKGRGLASDLDVDPAKAGLRAECTSGSALTGQAVTNRNADRITGCQGGKLAATTGRCSNDHSTYPRDGIVPA
jgi:hypothetical protein